MCKKIENSANAFIDHLKKSPVLNKTVGLVDGVIEEVNKNFKHEPISLDQLVARLSDDTDKEILQIQQQEALNFVGGELIVSSKASQDHYFSIDLKLYFKNSFGKIILKEKHKELELFILENSSKNDLLQKTVIKYEVDEPKV